MTIKSIGNKILSYTLSGLGNNSDSIIPMATKDLISDYAIVDTYRKNGTPDDVREKAIEEFGTAAVWLFGIPTLKKVIDKTVYPLFGLDPSFDLRIIENKEKFNEVTSSFGKKLTDEELKQKEIFNALEDKGKFLGEHDLPLKNRQLYKVAFLGKFAVATATCAVVLNKIIKYKQKTTQERINKDYYKKNASRILLSGNIKKHNPYNISDDEKKPISFTSLKFMKDFMYNPIKNTLILDGAIASTRIKEARNGEKKEVGLKEGFQLFFIYCIAKPLQIALETLGKRIKLPIGCDAKLIFDTNLKDKLEDSKDTISDLKNSKNLTKDLLSLDPKSDVADILDKNGTISLIKNKKGQIKGMNRFRYINEKDAIEELTKIEELQSHIGNLKGIKIYKTIAVLGNVAFAAWAMGVLQPMVNIWMRKKLNNGNNANPAISALESNALKDGISMPNPFKTQKIKFQ